MTDEPESPADPRPGYVPYFIDDACSECGRELVLLDGLENRLPIWWDEWVCPDPECDSGIHLDVPESYMVRNPERIDPLIELLREEWHEYPDLRLGQLVESVIGGESFYVEDTELARKLAERQGVENPLSDIEYYTRVHPWDTEFSPKRSRDREE